jgi:hypothetical protein
MMTITVNHPKNSDIERQRLLSMPHIRGALKGISGTITLVGGLLALLAWIFPELRRWFTDHGLAGWITAIVIMVVLPFAGATDSAVKRKRLDLVTDYEFVVRRLGNWTLDGDFYNYLRNHTNHSHFRKSIYDEIEVRCSEWEKDNREIKNKKLKCAFDDTKNAASAYHAKLFKETWPSLIGPGQPADYEYLCVPPEWEHEDPERFKSAHDELRGCWLDLVNALDNVFTLLHKMEPVSPPIG